MQEYTTTALVLDAEPAQEADMRVQLFTRDLGRVVCLVKAGRKPTAKLMPHLQPLTVAQVRLVEKKGVQLVDALSLQRLIQPTSSFREASELLAIAQLIMQQTALNQPDSELWELMVSGRLATRDFLRVLGFDPEHARCNQCRASAPQHFLLREAEYVCRNCFARARMSAGIVV